jgi:hypothetical protein
MHEAEKLEILQKLEAGRRALGEALVQVDDDLARRKPPEGGWSILQCMEHTVESERYLLSRLRISKISETLQENRAREAKIAERAANRARRIEAPGMVHPTGRFSSVQEALTAFDAVRAEVMAWAEDCTDDMRCLVTDHPLFAGPVTCYETLLMMAAHPARHALQILETREKLMKQVS